MNPVFDAVKENLQQIKIVFSPTPEAFRPDRKQTGDSRETSVSEFLQRFFPSSYAIKKKPIYSKDACSCEIDCVILSEIHPPLGSMKRTVIIAEGVFAAVEVKPDISTLTKKSEFYRALQQVQTVKRIDRLWKKGFADSRKMPKEPSMLADFSKIPTFIFCEKSRPLEDTLKFMETCVDEGDILPSELPDGIVSLQKGILFHSTTIWYSALHTLVEDSKNAKQQKQFNEGYIFLTEAEMALTNFIFILCNVCPPNTIIDRPILEKYLVGMPINFKLIPIYRSASILKEANNRVDRTGET